MNVRGITNDNEVKEMLDNLGLWDEFIEGRKLSDPGSGSAQVWSLCHTTTDHIYLFFGFDGYDDPIDNGYTCQKIAYKPDEAAKIAEYYNLLLSKIGDDWHS